MGRKTYSSAKRSYSRRRNVQAKRSRFRKFVRQQKVSIKTIKTIAKREAAKLDKKLPFKNQVQTVFGDWHDDPSDPAMYGRPAQWDQLTLNPTTYKILTLEQGLSPQDELCVPSMRTIAVSGQNNPLQDRLNRRMSDKIYVKGFTITGRIKLPINCPQEYIQLNLFEVKTAASHQSQVDTEAEYDAMIREDAIPPITGFQRINMQEDPLFRKTQRLLVNKVIKLENREAATSFVKQFSVKYFFKKPQMVQYMETDFDGYNPLNRFYWVSFRCSGIHDSVAENQGSYTVTPTQSSPEIISTLRVFYTDKGL